MAGAGAGCQTQSNGTLVVFSCIIFELVNDGYTMYRQWRYRVRDVVVVGDKDF